MFFPPGGWYNINAGTRADIGHSRPNPSTTERRLHPTWGHEPGTSTSRANGWAHDLRGHILRRPIAGGGDGCGGWGCCRCGNQLTVQIYWELAKDTTRNKHQTVCEITNQLRYSIRHFTPHMYSCGLSHVVEHRRDGNTFTLYLTVMEHNAGAHTETTWRCGALEFYRRRQVESKDTWNENKECNTEKSIQPKESACIFFCFVLFKWLWTNSIHTL